MPFPPPGDLPDPETELASPAAPALADGLLTSAPPGNNLGLRSTMRETQVQSLGWEDPLEKEKAIPTPVFWP